MKKILYLALTALSLLCSGCSLLDYEERSFASKEDAFSEISKTTAILTAAYNILPSSFNGIGDAMYDAATDDGIYAWDVSNIHNFYNGIWSHLSTVDDVWGHFYTGIRRANLFLENADDEVLEEYKWSGDYYQTTVKNWKFYRYEARFLRAFYHFELAKRYGDIPIVDHTLTRDEANRVVRTPFEEVVVWIASECEDIATNLPDNYRDPVVTPSVETGRVTRGAALALKSRALLYLASPLHNETNDTGLWKDAADAANELISAEIYPNELPAWGKVFNNWRADNTELILEKRMANSRSFESANFSIGFEGGNSGNCPTQNLVDCFEMKATGLGITENGSGYNPSRPYEGRDPRLKMTVLCNGDKWKGRQIESYYGGQDGLPKTGASPSGYYLKKHLVEKTVISGNKKTETEHCWILFRYSEVLLNYAEAMNEAYGPDFKDAEHTLSAREAVNCVRSRQGVDMPEFPVGMTQEAFRNKIRNERRVELAFEDHRMWDLRRWKDGALTKQIYGMDIRKDDATGNITYSPVKISERRWEDKMYFYPISQKEIYATKGSLVQNQGW